MVKNKNIYVSDYNYIPVIAEYCKLLSLDKSVHTIISYLSSIDRFFDFLDIETTKHINEIIPFMCREYQAKLKEDGLQSSSINAHIRNLKALFNWLKENEKIDDNPFEKVKNVKEPSKERSYMSLEEINKFFEACKNVEEKAMFLLYIQLGIRRSELANLKIEDVVDDIVQIRGKGSKDRTVAMPMDAYEMYLRYLEIRNEKYGNEIPYVFVSKNKKKYSGQAILLKYKTIMKRADFPQKRIDELHIHSCRHTFLANYLGDGNDIRMGQAILGHSSLSTTANIYSHIRNSAVVDSMRNQRRLVI